MYWSHFAERDYHPLLERAGFEVLRTRRIGHGYRDDADQRAAEVHPLVLARKGR